LKKARFNGAIKALLVQHSLNPMYSLILM